MRLPHISVFSMLNQMLVSYKVPSNINYFWSFGILAGLALVIQLITGIALAMHYTPHVDLAFLSVDHIMRDLQYGWLLRYLHSNGASFFFIVVYSHIFRGLYYGSYVYPRQMVWIIGCLIYIAMMAVAFLGYVLPWGQMSFWGATVITNFFSVIPFFGKDIVEWLWGGFSVSNATLNRFYSLHYFLSFVIVGLSALHLIVLHNHGANNPIGTKSVDNIAFYPYYYVKDLVAVNLYLLGYLFFVFFSPETLGHPDNYIPANPMVTPPSIVPEWYFLPMYAILRSIPHKTGGVLAMGLAVVVLLLVPLLSQPLIRSGKFRPFFAFFYWIFVLDCFLLGWAGCNHIESPWIEVGAGATIYYFAFFFIIMPLAVYVDNTYLEELYWNSIPVRFSSLTRKPYKPLTPKFSKSLDYEKTIPTTSHIDIRDFVRRPHPHGPYTRPMGGFPRQAFGSPLNERSEFARFQAKVWQHIIHKNYGFRVDRRVRRWGWSRVVGLYFWSHTWQYIRGAGYDHSVFKWRGRVIYHDLFY